jgi:mRNA interferase MazF
VSAVGRSPLSRGDVVLVQFPFTDLSGAKLRPAVIVGRVAGDDVILAFMTSRLAGAARGVTHDPATHSLDPYDPELARSGLKGPALIRLDKVATLHRRLVQRRLGHIGPRTEQAIARALRYVFEL